VWGELWLLPNDGLARLSLGWGDTMLAAELQGSRMRGPTVSIDAAYDQATRAEDLKRKVGDKRSNIWISLVHIRRARLRRGIINSRLQVKLSDGSKTKLLWPNRDPAYEVLSKLLEEQRGPQFTLR
jgi:hypothetical protein